MKTLQLLAITTLLVAFGFVTAAPAAWYVVQDKMGSVSVTDYLPGYGWTIVSGPYDTIDAAQRNMGTGVQRFPGGLSGDPAPSVPRAGVIVPEFFGTEEFAFEETPAPRARAPRQARASEQPTWEREAAAGKERMKEGMKAPAAESADMAVFALKGKDAVDRDGKALGRFDHIVISRDGRVDYVVLSHERKLIPIPWNALDVSSQKDALVLDMDKNKLANAPSIDKKDFLHALTTPDFKDKIHSFYQAAPRAEISEMDVPEMQKSADEAAAVERELLEAEVRIEGGPETMEK